MDDAHSQQLLVSTLLLLHAAQDLQHQYFSSVTKHHHVSIVNCALHLSLPDLKLFCDHFSKFLLFALSNNCNNCYFSTTKLSDLSWPWSVVCQCTAHYKPHRPTIMNNWYYYCNHHHHLPDMSPCSLNNSAILEQLQSRAPVLATGAPM